MFACLVVNANYTQCILFLLQLCTDVIPKLNTDAVVSSSASTTNTTATTTSTTITTTTTTRNRPGYWTHSNRGEERLREWFDNFATMRRGFDPYKNPEMWYTVKQRHILDSGVCVSHYNLCYVIILLV